VEFANDDFYVYAEVIFSAEYLDYFAARALRGAWPVGDFYVYYYAFEVFDFCVNCGFFAYDSVNRFPFRLLSKSFRLNIPTSGKFGQKWGTLVWALLAFGDHYFLCDFCIYGDYIVSSAAVVEYAYYRGMGAVDGPYYAAFGAAVGADIRYVSQDLVAVHRRADLMRGDEDVACEFGFQLAYRLGIGDDEAESVAVHAQASSNEVLVGGGLGELVAVRVDGDEFASLDQLLEMIVQLAALFAVQAQFAD
jgi:hypothetical protein